jgi:hypothetical protein
MRHRAGTPAAVKADLRVNRHHSLSRSPLRCLTTNPTETPMTACTDSTRWPATHVEQWPLEKLIPYARNSRTHTEA